MITIDICGTVHCLHQCGQPMWLLCSKLEKFFLMESGVSSFPESILFILQFRLKNLQTRALKSCGLSTLYMSLHRLLTVNLEGVDMGVSMESSRTAAGTVGTLPRRDSRSPDSFSYDVSETGREHLIKIYSEVMHSSAKLEYPPLSVPYFRSCDKVYHK